MLAGGGALRHGGDDCTAGACHGGRRDAAAAIGVVDAEGDELPAGDEGEPLAAGGGGGGVGGCLGGTPDCGRMVIE